MIYSLESIINTLAFYQLMHRKTPSFSYVYAVSGIPTPSGKPRPYLTVVYSAPSLVPRPLWEGKSGLAACACAKFLVNSP